MNINELEELAKEALPSEYFDIDFIEAATPSAILELIAAYREAVAALERIKNIDDEYNEACWIAVHALDTAKRLGVEL